MPTNAAVVALKAAAKGVTYESESDEPFEVFQWKAADVGDDLTAAGAAALGGVAGPAAELTVEQFFAPLVKAQKWHGDAEREVVSKYQALAEAVHAHLAESRVYKIGGGPEKTIYVVGRSKTGSWVGLKTTAVET